MSFTPERRVLITPEEISRRVKELAVTIARNFHQNKQESVEQKPRVLVLICILESARPFCTELALGLGCLGVPTQIEYVKASSYADGMTSSGTPIFSVPDDFEAKIAGKEVLIVEDMIDTGKTLKPFVAKVNACRPKSLQVVVLLKKKRHSESIGVDPYVGFNIDDLWVDGHGIDTANKNRELLAIWAFLQSKLQLKELMSYRKQATAPAAKARKHATRYSSRAN